MTNAAQPAAAPADPWSALRRHTAARIGLGRSGNSLRTDDWLQLAQAHALARDAVHAVLDADALGAALRDHGFAGVLTVDSAAPDRATYLRRPDLGRRLAAGSAARLSAAQPVPAPALLVVVGDGLSAAAAQTHALPLLLALQPLLLAQRQAVDAVVIARQARVALGDDVAARLGAGAVLVLLGERPGLSSPDSLGAYLTWAPGVGCSDARRNCVSNIRPQGLAIGAAARKLAWLLRAAQALGSSGVLLKDESDGGAAAAATLPLPAAQADGVTMPK